MTKLAILGMLTLLVFVVIATPVAAAGPPTVLPQATVEKVNGSFPICLTPTPLVFYATGGGAYSGRITFVPLYDGAIWPHGQMENSRFDFTWQGVLGLGVGSCDPLAVVPILPLAYADGPVSGRVMVHLHPALPTDTGEIVLPDGTSIFMGVPTTPYSISIIVDEPVQVLPGIIPSTDASQLQLTKGRLLFVR